MRFRVIAGTALAAGLITPAVPVAAAGTPSLLRDLVVTGRAGTSVEVSVPRRVHAGGPLGTVVAGSGDVAGFAIVAHGTEGDVIPAYVAAYTRRESICAGCVSTGDETDALETPFDPATASETVLVPGRYTFVLIGSPGALVTARLRFAELTRGKRTLRTRTTRQFGVEAVGTPTGVPGAQLLSVGERRVTTAGPRLLTGFLTAAWVTDTARLESSTCTERGGVGPAGLVCTGTSSSGTTTSFLPTGNRAVLTLGNAMAVGGASVRLHHRTQVRAAVQSELAVRAFWVQLPA